MNKLVEEEKIVVARYGKNNKRFIKIKPNAGKLILPIDNFLNKDSVTVDSMDKIHTVNLNVKEVKFGIKFLSGKVKNIFCNCKDKDFLERVKFAYSTNVEFRESNSALEVPVAARFNINVEQVLKSCKGFVDFRTFIERLIKSCALLATKHKKPLNALCEILNIESKFKLKYCLNFFNLRSSNMKRALILELIKSTESQSKELVALEKKMLSTFSEVDFEVLYEFDKKI